MITIGTLNFYYSICHYPVCTIYKNPSSLQKLYFFSCEWATIREVIAFKPREAKVTTTIIK